MVPRSSAMRNPLGERWQASAATSSMPRSVTPASAASPTSNSRRPQSLPRARGWNASATASQLAPALYALQRRTRRRADRVDPRQSPGARRHPLLPRRRLRRGFAARLSRHGRAARGTDAVRRCGHRLPAGARTHLSRRAGRCDRRVSSVAVARIDASSIVIAGDSAGGNLALVTLLRARDARLPLPGGAVLLSPWTDLTGSGASMRTQCKRDPMLPAQRVDEAARLYAPTRQLIDPDVSPLFGDFRLAATLDPCRHDRNSARRLAAPRQTRAEQGVSVATANLAPHAARVSDVRRVPPEGRRRIELIRRS